MTKLKKSSMREFMRQLRFTPRNLNKNYKANHNLIHCKFFKLIFIDLQDMRRKLFNRSLRKINGENSNSKKFLALIRLIYTVI